MGSAVSHRVDKDQARRSFCIKWRRIDNSLQKREGGVSLIPVPDRTLAMSTAIIPGLPGLFRPARRFSAVDLRIEDGLFGRMLSGKGPPENKIGPGSLVTH